jgi:hypothetical protein
MSSPSAYDPEARPSLLRAASRLPVLLYRLARWRALRGGWLARHLARGQGFDRRRLPAGSPIDVVVVVVDHYEPARSRGDQAAVESVRSWCAGYEQLVRKHRDADGRPPQHTWFYRYDYPNEGCLQALSEAVFRGLGEVEFHLHHDHDTHASFAARIQAGLEWFGRHGAMVTAEASPRRLFGYIAGNSSLDNGTGDATLGGCDTEVAALRDAGCFADFTFPSLGSPAQPRTTNSIYYAVEDGRPKSYDTGAPVAVGRPPSGDLMIFQGPTAFNWADGCVDDGMLENTSPAHPRRLAAWLSAHVHVPGRPEWVFVKLATHAMQNQASFLGAGTDATFAAMERWWNRPPFRLHYVTAREAYNIAKAAEAGRSGDPNDYRDFVAPKPANRLVACDRAWRLLSYTPRRVHLRVLGEGEARVEFAEGPLRRVAGAVREVEVQQPEGGPAVVRLGGEGPFELTGRDGAVWAAAGEEWVACPARGETVAVGPG